MSRLITTLLCVVFLTACSVNETVPEKTYTEKQISDAFTNSQGVWTKTAEPCFYVGEITFPELDKVIAFPVNPEITCQGDSF